jgi:hypothetical protein
MWVFYRGSAKVPNAVKAGFSVPRNLDGQYQITYLEVA